MPDDPSASLLLPEQKITVLPKEASMITRFFHRHFTPKNFLSFIVGSCMAGLAWIPLFVPTTHLMWLRWQTAIGALIAVGLVALFFRERIQSREDHQRDEREEALEYKFEEMHSILRDLAPHSITAKSEPIPLLDAAPDSESEPVPDIEMTGYQYLWLKPDHNHVWRIDLEGRKSLLFIFTNNPDEDGKGLDAFAVRAQVSFEWDTGARGPSFSPVPWLGEEHAFIDIPLGVEKKAVIGVSLGQQMGWSGQTYKRLNSNWPKGTSPSESNPIPDRGKMVVQLIASVGGKSQAIWKSCFSWKVEYSTNHPWFNQISCSELKKGVMDPL